MLLNQDVPSRLKWVLSNFPLPRKHVKAALVTVTLDEVERMFHATFWMNVQIVKSNKKQVFSKCILKHASSCFCHQNEGPINWIAECTCVASVNEGLFK